MTIDEEVRTLKGIVAEQRKLLEMLLAKALYITPHVNGIWLEPEAWTRMNALFDKLSADERARDEKA